MNVVREISFPCDAVSFLTCTLNCDRVIIAHVICCNTWISYPNFASTYQFCKREHSRLILFFSSFLTSFFSYWRLVFRPLNTFSRNIHTHSSNVLDYVKPTRVRRSPITRVLPPPFLSFTLPSPITLIFYHYKSFIHTIHDRRGIFFLLFRTPLYTLFEKFLRLDPWYASLSCDVLRKNSLINPCILYSRGLPLTARKFSKPVRQVYRCLTTIHFSKIQINLIYSYLFFNFIASLFY